MPETLADFYRIKFNHTPPNLHQDIGHVNVFRIDDYHGNSTTPVPYNRRDFYKISLIRGHNEYHYADKSIEVNGPVLLFFSPHVPYTWESLSGSMSGYFCVFKKAFLPTRAGMRSTDCPCFGRAASPPTS